ECWRYFYAAEDRRKVKCCFWIGCLRDAPGFLESFDVEESQSCQSLRNRARRQLALLEQLGLIFTNWLMTQTIWRALESSCEIFNCANVTACGSLRIITTLEFFEHHFAKSGHEDLLMTRQLTSPVRHKLLRSPHAKRPPRGRLRSEVRLSECGFSAEG